MGDDRELWTICVSSYRTNAWPETKLEKFCSIQLRFNSTNSSTFGEGRQTDRHTAKWRYCSTRPCNRITAPSPFHPIPWKQDGSRKPEIQFETKYKPWSPGDVSNRFNFLYCVFSVVNVISLLSMKLAIFWGLRRVVCRILADIAVFFTASIIRAIAHWNDGQYSPDYTAQKADWNLTKSIKKSVGIKSTEAYFFRLVYAEWTS